MHCPLCGTANPAQARFCLGCGQLLVSGLVCTVCHALLPPHARYCFHCGALVLAPAEGLSSMAFGGLPDTLASAHRAPAPGRLGSLSHDGREIGVAQAENLPSPAFQPSDLPSFQLGQLPPPCPVQEMLPSLQRYLTHALYEPMERRPTAQDLAKACQHLAAVLNMAKTYLPRPVVLAPQPPGQASGGLFQGSFLFVDVSGFTPLSERLKSFKDGAERITTIINGLFNDLVTILHAHGGTLLKFGGDALLGLFGEGSGAPVSTVGSGMAEGALLAVQAALAMQAVMSKFAAIPLPTVPLPAVPLPAVGTGGMVPNDVGGESTTHALRIKCGISSGSYFAAHFGTPRSMAYVTTGHTVNRADQAEGHANPGEIVLAQATYELLAAQIEAEPRDEGFYLVHAAPEPERLPAPWYVDEPPPGDTQAQITYLVERLDRLSPYLPAELLPRLVTNPDPAKLEFTPDYRRVTVMFANYVGVSDLIEDMGDSRPDLITAHLNDYFVHMAEIVSRYDGSLARMDQYSVGDRLVIFFGAPRVHEDDPVRAVNAALDMQEATRQHFSALQLPEGVYRFRQRIGINTGTLFAGNVGVSDIEDKADRPDRRQEYTLMGDDINMAARLMSKAEWNEILISDKTQKEVKAYFDLRDRGQLKVKGKEILIPTFQVLTRRDEIGRTRGLGEEETPLADREDELLVLQRCGEALMGGRGQIVSIVGDSGLGKSRLMRELQHRLFGNRDASPGDEGRWLEGHALSFSEQVSYWLAAQVLHRAIEPAAPSVRSGLPSVGGSPTATPLPSAPLPAVGTGGTGADDTLYTLWEQGEALLGKATAREAIPFLAHLLDLPLKGEWEHWVADLSPKVRQKQTFWAVREFFAALARQQPVVIALDDLHWADEASLALLEDLLQVVDRAPLMFILIFRERRDKGCWRLRDQAAASFPHRYTEVALKPLSDACGRELLSQLLPGVELAPGIVQEILDKTAGNPFYLEEVVRSLQDGHLVVPDDARPGCWKLAVGIERITVPDTLQGALLARIDRLAEDARQGLQMAAVIGRRFQVEALRGLAGAQAEMESWLAQLERSGLIRPVAAAAEPAYTFPDALVQEVAYESLLVRRRQEFHRRVGETLEAILGDGTDQECELLAYHFGRSDDQQRAIHYLEMAGRKAQANFANETAVRYYSDLLALLSGSARFEVLARRQQVYGLVGEWQARQADLEAMLPLAALGTGELAAQPEYDQARRSDVLNAFADLHQATSHYSEAEQAASEALALKTELGDQAGQAEALQQLGTVYYFRGDYAQARPLLEQAVVLRQATGNPEGESWSLMYLGMIHFMQGDYGQAAQLHEHAYQVAESRGDWFQMGVHLTNMARVSLRLGEYEKALDQLDRSLERKRRVGDRNGQGFSLFYLGLVHTYLDRYDDASSALAESLELRRQIGDQRGVGYCLNGLGQVALGQGNSSQAADYFRQAYDLRSRLGLKAETIVDLSYLGQACLELGQANQAAEASEQAITLLAEQKSVEEVQQIYFHRFRVLAARDDPMAGRVLRQAYDMVLEQANRIADLEKRQTFLGQNRVNRQIIAAIGLGV